ncbi:hypothetical protein [Streptomyces sp. NPDC089919]|uniref:hypothetical protein n=1 Tax=Streptomyces sp. NPDC089919 TaxID=3155188 RepID=UPI003417A74B
MAPELFARLAAFCADEYGLEQGAADRVMDQALAFVWVVGATRAAEFGCFVHHAPHSKVRTRGLMGDVVGRIRAAGFEVDERLWGTAAECNQSACCGDGSCC